jgi:hypothetical protein
MTLCRRRSLLVLNGAKILPLTMAERLQTLRPPSAPAPLPRAGERSLGVTGFHS